MNKCLTPIHTHLQTPQAGVGGLRECRVSSAVTPFMSVCQCVCVCALPPLSAPSNTLSSSITSAVLTHWLLQPWGLGLTYSHRPLSPSLSVCQPAAHTHTPEMCVPNCVQACIQHTHFFGADPHRYGTDVSFACSLGWKSPQSLYHPNTDAHQSSPIGPQSIIIIESHQETEPHHLHHKNLPPPPPTSSPHHLYPNCLQAFISFSLQAAKMCFILYLYLYLFIIVAHFVYCMLNV